MGDMSWPHSCYFPRENLSVFYSSWLITGAEKGMKIWLGQTVSKKIFSRNLINKKKTALKTQELRKKWLG